MYKAYVVKKRFGPRTTSRNKLRVCFYRNLFLYCLYSELDDLKNGQCPIVGCKLEKIEKNSHIYRIPALFIFCIGQKNEPKFP